jgi:hypothetical protein
MWFFGTRKQTRTETPEARYNGLIGAGSLLSSEVRDLASVTSNISASKLFLSAAFFANENGLGDRRVMDAALKAYDAASKAGNLALSLKRNAFAIEPFIIARVIARTFELGTEAIDSATTGLERSSYLGGLLRGS